MAITATNKDSSTNIDSVGGNTYCTTNSVTTTTGLLYLLTLYTSAAVTSISTVNGITWTLINSQTVGTATQYLYYGVCSTGGTGTWQVNFGSMFQHIAYIIDEVTGHDTTTPIVQNVKGSSATSPITLTLAAFGNINNATYATWDFNTTAPDTVTKEGTWTILKAQTSGTSWTSTVPVTFLTDYIVSNDTTASCTWTTTYGSHTMYGIAIEIKAAAVVGGTIAGTGSSITYGGTAWANPTRITASDTSYATVSVINGAASDYLIGSNFGFNIPTYSTIVGIQITVKGLYSGGAPGRVGVFAGDTGSGPAGSGNSITLTTSDSTVTYGDSATLMTGVTLTPAMVNVSTFGVGLVGYAVASGTTNFSIDAIWCQLWYTYNAATCTVKNSMMTLGCGI